MEYAYEAGFLGCGNMGGILAAVAAKSAGGDNILAVDRHPEKTARLREAYGIRPATVADLAGDCHFVFLGVKPQGLSEAAAELLTEMERRNGRFVAVSMAAGVSLSDVWRLLDGCPVIRIMPNTPCAVGEGVILYSAGVGVTMGDEEAFLRLMDPAGAVLKIDESKMDMASAVTGCGPAFAYLFMEAMTEGAVRCGLPRDKALSFVLRTMGGAAKLALASGQDPALLRAAVCSPAGSTIAGIAALEEHRVRYAVMEAVEAAYRRTLELGRS